MKNISLIFILCIATMFSCTNSEKIHPITNQLLASQSLQIERGSDFTVINHENAETLSFEDFNAKIKDIHYIPFFSEQPIGVVDRLIIFDKYVIVLDAFKTESIFIFDISGKLINVIHDKGGGPKEYHGLSDISINKEDSLIVVYDRMVSNMLYFTLDGQFVKKTRSTPCFYFETFNNKTINLLGFAQSFSHDIYENFNVGVSIKDSIQYKGFPYYPIQIQAVDYRGLWYNHKNELLYKPNLSDTIYQFVNDSTLYVKYVVIQKKNIWEKRDENLSSQEYHTLVKKSNYTYLCTPILETENFLAYRIANGIMGHVASTGFWYDKDTKQSFTFRGYRNPSYQPNCIPLPMTVWNNYYAGIFLPSGIEMFENMTKNGVTLNEDLTRILENGMRENLEFILVMYELQ